MRRIHYEVCTGKHTSIRNGGSVMVYDAVLALAEVLLRSSPRVQTKVMMTDYFCSESEILFLVMHNFSLLISEGHMFSFCHLSMSF